MSQRIFVYCFVWFLMALFLRAHEIVKWQNRSLTLKTISIRPLMVLAIKQRIEDANCIFLPLLGV
jgi:hypothetical protein